MGWRKRSDDDDDDDDEVMGDVTDEVVEDVSASVTTLLEFVIGFAVVVVGALRISAAMSAKTR